MPVSPHAVATPPVFHVCGVTKPSWLHLVNMPGMCACDGLANFPLARHSYSWDALMNQKNRQEQMPA